MTLSLKCRSLRICVVHAVELHDVQPHDPIGDVANDLLFSRRAMSHDVIGGVPRMLFIGDFVHHEKLAALIVEAVVLAQRISNSSEYRVRIVSLVNPETRVSIGEPKVSVAQHDAHVHEIFEGRSRDLEIFLFEAHGKTEALDQVRMMLLLGELSRQRRYKAPDRERT